MEKSIAKLSRNGLRELKNVYHKPTPVAHELLQVVGLQLATHVDAPHALQDGSVMQTLVKTQQATIHSTGDASKQEQVLCTQKQKQC